MDYARKNENRYRFGCLGSQYSVYLSDVHDRSHPTHTQSYMYIRGSNTYIYEWLLNNDDDEWNKWNGCNVITLESPSLLKLVFACARSATTQNFLSFIDEYYSRLTWPLWEYVWSLQAHYNDLWIYLMVVLLIYF